MTVSMVKKTTTAPVSITDLFGHASDRDYKNRYPMKHLGTRYTRKVAVPNGAKPTPLLITGDEAREMLSHAEYVMREVQSFGPVEVGIDRTECNQGCKIMAQKNFDQTLSFYVQHYGGYGCDLAENSQRSTRQVIVSTAPLGTAWTAVSPVARFECSE